MLSECFAGIVGYQQLQNFIHRKRFSVLLFDEKVDPKEEGPLSVDSCHIEDTPEQFSHQLDVLALEPFQYVDHGGKQYCELWLWEIVVDGDYDLVGEFDYLWYDLTTVDYCSPVNPFKE